VPLRVALGRADAEDGVIDHLGVREELLEVGVGAAVVRVAQLDARARVERQRELAALLVCAHDPVADHGPPELLDVLGHRAVVVV
jgi:hypothetical protein